jgi:hypothetical protein
MLIGSRKYKKVKEKVHEQYTHYCVLFCNLTNKANISVFSQCFPGVSVLWF